MARKYIDYIQIAEDFIPFYTEDKDKTFPTRWKSFYPHESFVGLLRAMVSTLEGAKDEHKKSLWLRGSYGTGKTYAAFALKHLLEDDKKEVNNYFEKYVQLSEILHNKLDNIKEKGRILVATRSSSSGITNDNLLFYSIAASIRKELEIKGFSYFGEHSQYENVVKAFNNGILRDVFPRLFEKYQDRFLEFTDSNSLIEELTKMDPTRYETGKLVSDIVDICSQEGIQTFIQTPESLCDWIADVKKGNNLQAIVLIWDEFTNYFEINANKTSGLQEIAHKSGETNFYLMLITHKSPTQFAIDNATAKILEARFKQIQLEMANATAYTFMAQSIDINPNLKAEWLQERSKLWETVEHIASKTIFDFTEVDENDIRYLLPMHPFSIYLLKQISEQMSSNQRTMYKYLSSDSDEDNQKNFRWYIKNNSIEDWRLLTADYIWDYFFNLDNVSVSDDLSEKCKININHYLNYEQLCENDDEKRILKVVLMLDAINTGSGRKAASKLLQASLKNIITAFEGSKIKDNVRFILSKLESKGILGSVDNGNGDVIYMTRSTTVNEDQFSELRKGVERDYSFESLINNANSKVNFIESYKIPDIYKGRFIEIKATYSNLKKKIDEYKLTDNYHIGGRVPLIFILAKNQHEAVETPTLINTIKNSYDGDIVFIDMANKPFGDDRYNKFIDKMTYVKYCMTTNDNSQIGIYQQDGDKLLRSWKSDLDAVNMSITVGRDDSKEIMGISKFTIEIKEINKRLFPYSLENYLNNTLMFKMLGNKEDVPRMGMGIMDITPTFRYLDEIKNILANNKAWKSNSYEIDNPDFFISKMKKRVNEVIKNSFLKNESFSVLDIWSMLRNKPFGLMDTIASGFVLGFLLKEYANSGFYKRDGQKNPEPLNDNQLANIIIACIVSPKKIENIVIRKRTEEQIKFCQYSSKVFKLSKDVETVEEVYTDVRSWLTESINFPLWGLLYYVKTIEDKYGYNETIKKIIKLYCSFISPKANDEQDENRIVGEIVKLVKSDSGVESYLCDIVSKENIKTGIYSYVVEKNDNLVLLSKKLKLENNLLDSIRSKFRDYTWLWEEADIIDQINEVYVEYQIILAVKTIYPKNIISIAEAFTVLREKVSSIKMPYVFFKEEVADMTEFYEYMRLIYKDDTKGLEKTRLLNQLNINISRFSDFCDNQADVFFSICVNEMKEHITQADSYRIFEDIQSNQFMCPYDSFVSGIKNKIVNFAKNKKLTQVIELWQKKTSTKNPKEWSDINSMPIIFLFGKLRQKAKFAFGVINGRRSDLMPQQYDEILEFINDSSINILSDINKCNEMFLNDFGYNYAAIINDVNDLKKVLREIIEGNPYDWTDCPSEISNTIKDYATKLYKLKQEEVSKKIDKLSEFEAKKYLLELIKNEPIIGIKLLKE